MKNLKWYSLAFFRNCRYGSTVYTTFKLHNKLDLNVINYDSWTDLQESIRKLKIGPIVYNVLTNDLYQEIDDMKSITSINFTKYREYYGKSVTSHDLNTFLQQVEYVSNKISDSSSANSLNAIYIKIKNILKNELKLIVKDQENILYELTGLEILFVSFKNHTDALHYHLNFIREHLLKHESAIVNDVSLHNIKYPFL